MTRNWRAEEDRRNDRYGRDERAHGRGYGEDRGRGSYGDPRRMSGSPTYGSDFGASDPRASWSGMDQGDARGWHGSERDYDRYPEHERSGPIAKHNHEDDYGSRYDRPYDEDRSGRDRVAGRSPYGNRNWSGGRSDWGRQEWGMSGPQQGNYGYGRQMRDHGRAPESEERGLWDRATDEVASWFGDEEAERRRTQDQYRGVGPKNYSRSDDRVREDISDRLTDDWRVDASEIEITVVKGEVTLAGSVTDRMQRRRAEDIADSVSGARHVQNNLRVRDKSASGAAGGEVTAVTPGQSSTISSRNT